ncbi:hypothetical protein [Kitasatospora sp. GP82]|uniref:hypothetical protein n=1 Tax=Kitasatospora sp. GP82 TaxID=3035089 RepID=UPI002474CC2C|nr:hypothetical protein [Kitasatospora sp. GP82]MDH6126753.1 hypothetical protein [Kitasatospora sp. GP82]
MRRAPKAAAVSLATAAAFALATPAATATPVRPATTVCADLRVGGAVQATLCKSWWRVRPGVYNGKWWTTFSRYGTQFYVNVDGSVRRVHRDHGSWTGARYAYMEVCDAHSDPQECSGWW